MKKLLLILATIATLTAKAQTSVYYPFPDSNAIWNVYAQGCCWSNCPPPPNPNPVLGDFNFSYTISGDTVINSVTYHKLYKSGTEHEHCDFGNFIDNWYVFNDYAGAYRQDTLLKQVFFINIGLNTECLLYDFSLNVGDFVGGCEGFCTTINSIDSVLIGNNYRKRFNIFTLQPYSIIEGIGSTSGLLEPLCPFEYLGTLMCFSQNGMTLYPDTTTNCEIITSVKNIYPEKYFQIVSPNPFTNELNFKTNSNELSEIVLYDITSRKLLQQKFTNSVSINTERLAKGIYIYEVRNKSGLCKKGKVVKD